MRLLKGMSPAITLLPRYEPSPRAARSHAMKNSVSVVLAIASLIDAHIPPEHRARWMRLREAATRMQALAVEDLAEETDALDLREVAEECPVHCLIDEVVDRLVDRAASAGVELFVQCGGGMVRGERIALGEALFNLLANAIEGTPRGKHVFFGTHAAVRGDQHWVLEDSGNGMTDGDIANLGEKPRSTKPNGSGYGLALARATFARHGGLFRVESLLDAGTTIRMWLPTHASAPA